MSTKFRRGAFLASTAITALLSLGLAASARAADTPASKSDADTTVQEVVVTGSHIPRAGFETLEPANLVTAQTLQDRAFSSVAEALNELPTFGIPGSSNRGGQAASNVGQEFVDLYGLGSQRTLTLVNGRRFVSSNPPTALSGAAAGLQVDLTTLPVGLIDHVEVVSVGGAPTYGADAVAGVVNVVLKDKFQGVETEATYGQLQDGKGKNYQVRGLVGTNFADDRGNVTISAEYTEKDRLTYNDSNYLATHNYTAVQSGACGVYQSCLINYARVPSLSYGGVPSSAALPLANIPGFSVLNSAGQSVAFAKDGTLQPFNFGNTAGSVVFASGGDGLDLNALTTLQSPQQRRLLNGLAHYDFTEHLTGYTEFFYSNSTAVQPSNQPTYQSALFAANGPGQSDASNALIFSVNNPFLTPQARAILVNNFGPNGTFALSRANVDLAPQDQRNEVNVYRFVGGFKGDVTLLNHKVKWDAAFNYGRSEAQASQYDIWDEAFTNALNAVVDPATGKIVCNVTLNPPAAAPGGRVNQAVAGCVPLNLFGQGAPSQAAKNFVTKQINQTSTLTERDVTLNANTSLFDLPAGAVKVAGGFEFRQEYADFQVDGFTQAGLGRNSPVSPLGGHYNTTEFYGETTVPVVSPAMKVPFVYNAQLEGSYRRIDNSIEGNDDVYTVGGRFAPIEEVTFRGNVTHSVRAPAVEELYLPSSQTFSFATDPCSAAHINDKPTYAANCAAAFAAVGASAALPGFQSIIQNASQPGTQGGNPNLKNEEANSWTAGFVAHPKFIKGLTLSMDWINIHLKNPITQLSLSQVLAACYSSSSYPNVTYQGYNYCSSVTRAPVTGQIINFSLPTLNIGSREFAGLQMEATYRMDVTDFPYLPAAWKTRYLGSLTYDVSAFYEDKANIKPLGTDQSYSKIRGGFGDPDWKANASIRYRNGPLGLYLNARYMSPQKFDPNAVPTALNVGGVPDYYVFNGNISYDVTKQATLSLAISDLFDQAPPTYAAYSGSAAQIFDVFGRSYSVTLRSKF